MLSRRHARVWYDREGRRWQVRGRRGGRGSEEKQVEDLKSMNGTYVNGERVERRELQVDRGRARGGSDGDG
eukprot:755765-Hanusia_phi.AAC.1